MRRRNHLKAQKYPALYKVALLILLFAAFASLHCGRTRPECQGLNCFDLDGGISQKQPDSKKIDTAVQTPGEDSPTTSPQDASTHSSTDSTHPTEGSIPNPPDTRTPSEKGHHKDGCVPKTCKELGKECGATNDGCGNLLRCGNCPSGLTCGVPTANLCGCVPQCNGRTCGPDPVCGKSCGTCGVNETCTSGKCVNNTGKCIPKCKYRQCGDNGCGGSCGSCKSGDICLDYGCRRKYNGPKKKCTENDIRSAIASKSSFSFQMCNQPSGIIGIKKTLVIRRNGFTLDGIGKMRLEWKGGGTCNKVVGQPSIIDIRGNNNKLIGFEVIRAPDGIHVSEGRDNLLERIVFPKVCEDAITNGNKRTSSARGTIIRSCKFLNGTDKAIQSNGGSLTVENCYFKDVKRAIGPCSEKADPGFHGVKPCPVASHIKAFDNTIINCSHYGMRASGKGRNAGTLDARRNTFINCKGGNTGGISAEEDGKVTARDNIFKPSCDYAFINRGSGSTIRICQGNVNQCKNLSKGPRITSGNCP